MTDLDRLEALVGSLPKGRHYESVESYCTSVYTDRDAANAALAEAYVAIERLAEQFTELVERQAKMLRRLAFEAWEAAGEPGDPMPEEFVEFYLADIARRVERSGQEADDAAADAWFGGEPR